MAELSFLAHHFAHAAEFMLEALAGIDDLVQRVINLAGHAGALRWEANAEIAVSKSVQNPQQVRLVNDVGVESFQLPQASAHYPHLEMRSVIIRKSDSADTGHTYY